jgi:hypothetical protein
MGEKKDYSKVILGVLLVLLALVNVVGFNILGNKVDEPTTVKLSEESVTALNDAVNSLNDATSALNEPESTEASVEEVTSTEGYTLTKREYERQVTEDKAIELATKFLEDRDFKKLLRELLIKDNDNVTLEYEGVDLDSYRDITEVIVNDVEFNRTSKTVTFDLVVKFFVDGDEEETMKAYVNKVEVKLSELEFDDDFEDAEVIEDEKYFDNIDKLKAKEI